MYMNKQICIHENIYIYMYICTYRAEDSRLDVFGGRQLLLMV